MKKLIRERSMMVLGLVVTVLLAAPAARAVVITQSTAGVLVADGFDSDTPGTGPAGWSLSPGFSSSNPEVESVAYDTTNSLVPAPATANQPPNFLALRGDAQAAYQIFPAGPYTSGTITATFAFYISSTGDSNVFPDFLHGSSPASFEDPLAFVSPTWISTDDSSTPDGSGQGQVAFYEGPILGYKFLTTGGGGQYDFTLNAWHDASVSYNIALGGAATALTIKVDGTTLDPLTATNPDATGSVTGFTLYDNAAGSASSFIDGIPGDIPEPASLGLLMLGGVTLLRRRRA